MERQEGYVRLGSALRLVIGIDGQASLLNVEQRSIVKARLESIEEGNKALFIREPLGRELNQDVTSMVSWPEKTPSSAVSSIEMMSRKVVFYGHDHAISIYGNSKIEACRAK